MKQPEKFSTDKPLKPGTIYQLKQGSTKVVCSKESSERLNLTGHWIVIKEFENEIIKTN